MSMITTVVGAQGDPCTVTILWSIVFPHLLYSASSPLSRRSAVSYITESNHSLLVPWKCLPTRLNLSSSEATRSQRLCEAVTVAIWHLPKIGMSTEEVVCQTSFWWLLPFVCRFHVVHISPTITGEMNSHHPQSPMRVEGIHTTGCCPVPRRDRLRHCCHHLSTMQPSARCLTPWLRWTRALFAVLGRYPPPQRGRLGLDFEGVISPVHCKNIIISSDQ
jgi:hypothetical protein